MSRRKRIGYFSSLLIASMIFISSPKIASAEQTTALTASQITVLNNSNAMGEVDYVEVTGIEQGSIIKGYDALTGGSAFIAVTSDDTSVHIDCPSNHIKQTGGTIYVSIQNPGCDESTRVAKDYLGERTLSLTDLDQTAEIERTIAGIPDLLSFPVIAPTANNTIVRLYDSASGGNLLFITPVTNYYSIANKNAVIPIQVLGMAEGSVYLTIQNPSMQESSRIKVNYSSKGCVGLTAEEAANIEINNIDSDIYVGPYDSITMKNIPDGATKNVLIYDSLSATSNLINLDFTSADDTFTLSFGDGKALQLNESSPATLYFALNDNGSISTRTPITYKSVAGASIPQAATPSASEFSISNKKDDMDTIVYSGPDDTIVNFYSAQTGGTLIGTLYKMHYQAQNSIINNNTYYTLQLGTGAGSIYASVIKPTGTESNRVKLNYSGEDGSTVPSGGGDGGGGRSGSTDAPSATSFVIVNNVGISDTITYTGNAGDIIKIYTAQTGGTLLGTITVASGKTTAVFTKSQLGTGAGSVYASLKRGTNPESARTQLSYGAERKTDPPKAEDATVTNCTGGLADTISVKNIAAGDTLYAYSAATGGTLLGSKVSVAGVDDTIITVKQLGLPAGSVYLTVKTNGCVESDRIKVDYDAEELSKAPENIKVSNNVAGIKDTVEVTDIVAGDTVKVYADATAVKPLGSTVVGTGKTSAIVSIAQLGVAEGSVYVTVTKKNTPESIRVKADYSNEQTTAKPDGDGQVIVANNTGGIKDTVKVTGVAAGNEIKIYNAETLGKVIGKAVVPTGANDVTITISQLGMSNGSIYVTVKSYGKFESDRVKIDYIAEVLTNAPGTESIKVANNVGAKDTVTVSNLIAGDTVKVYADDTNTVWLGKAAVPKGKTEALVPVKLIGTDKGSVYVTVTNTKAPESNRVKVDFMAEPVAPQATNIIVNNNALGIADTIKVSGLTEGDTIKVYKASSGGTAIGTQTVGSGETSATVSVDQLGVVAGKVYVSVTPDKGVESLRTLKAYDSETSAALLVANISVTNNHVGILDTIEVSGVTAGDLVSAYSVATGGTAIGAATVEEGNSYAVIKLDQLGTTSSKVYVSVKKPNKAESTRVVKTYLAEPAQAIPAAPLLSDITVSNQVAADTITVANVPEGCTIHLYGSATGLNDYASSTSEDRDTIIETLNDDGGIIYISIKNDATGLESKRVAKEYGPEIGNSLPLDMHSIAMTDSVNEGYYTITITGLTAGDLIKVYKYGAGSTLIGSVTASGTTASIDVLKSDTDGGIVWLSLTSPGKNESMERTKGAVE